MLLETRRVAGYYAVFRVNQLIELTIVPGVTAELIAHADQGSKL